MDAEGAGKFFALRRRSSGTIQRSRLGLSSASGLTQRGGSEDPPRCRLTVYVQRACLAGARAGAMVALPLNLAWNDSHACEPAL